MALSVVTGFGLADWGEIQVWGNMQHHRGGSLSAFLYVLLASCSADNHVCWWHTSVPPGK
jgi:hypothetical protein